MQSFLHDRDMKTVDWDWNEPYHVEGGGQAGRYYIRIYTESDYSTSVSYAPLATFPWSSTSTCR